MIRAIGRVENGTTVRLGELVDWRDGQEVLVIALPARPVNLEAPPDDLLDEDAVEFAVRPDALSEINQSELA